MEDEKLEEKENDKPMVKLAYRMADMKKYSIADFIREGEKLKQGYSVDEIMIELKEEEIRENGHNLADYAEEKEDEKIQSHIEDLMPENGKKDSKRKKQEVMEACDGGGGGPGRHIIFL